MRSRSPPEYRLSECLRRDKDGAIPSMAPSLLLANAGLAGGTRREQRQRPDRRRMSRPLRGRPDRECDRPRDARFPRKRGALRVSDRCPRPGASRSRRCRLPELGRHARRSFSVDPRLSLQPRTHGSTISTGLLAATELAQRHAISSAPGRRSLTTAHFLHLQRARDDDSKWFAPTRRGISAMALSSGWLSLSRYT